MKKYLLLLTALMVGSGSLVAGTTESEASYASFYNYRGSIVFTEGGITFSVYPDGEFDFYMDNQVAVGGRVRGGAASITFNSGYDYSPYLQYDDYGAVIQIENIPVYYDFYGRVTQIGNVDIRYRGNRVFRVGGLHVYYNGGYFSHFRGYINVYNRYYTYLPYHGYFVRPAVNFCLVYNVPYRRYYSPIRYTYYRPYRNNFRRPYATLGQHYRNNGRVNRRATVYRNDSRVAVRTNSGRRSNSVATSDMRRAGNSDGIRRNSGVTRNAQARSSRNEGVVRRGTNSQSRSSGIQRSNARRGESINGEKRAVSTSNRTGDAVTTRRSTATGSRNQSYRKADTRSIKRSTTTSGRSVTTSSRDTGKRQVRSTGSTQRSAVTKRATTGQRSAVTKRTTTGQRAQQTQKRAASVKRSPAKVASRPSTSVRKSSPAQSRNRTQGASRSRSTRSRVQQ